MQRASWQQGGKRTVMVPISEQSRMLDEGCANFTMSSSLPPMVMGDVAGEVELSVPFLYLKPGVLRPSNLRNHKSGPLFAVRVKWWGDSGPGTVLKPGLLNIRDEKGEKARRANLTNATRALFPVRCDLDGLVTYLKDMGHIALDILVHESETRGARQIGRCVIPAGNWDGRNSPGPSGQEKNDIADGYYPVLSQDGGKYAGDLSVRLRACLGVNSLLRRVLEAAKTAADIASMRGETLEIMRVLGQDDVSGIDQSPSVPSANHDEQDAVRASLDTDDFSESSSLQVVSPAKRMPRESAPLSSFQLNEALAKFDVSDVLPVWPAPKGSLYIPPETRGGAPLTRCPVGQTGREQLKRNLRSNVSDRKIYPVLPHKGRGTSTPSLRNTVVRTKARIAHDSEDPNDGNRSVEEPAGFASSASPQLTPQTNLVPLGVDEGRDADPRPSSPGSPESPRPKAVSPTMGRRDEYGMCLAHLLDRGKELRDKMAKVAGDGNHVSKSVTNSRDQVAVSVDSLTAPGLDQLAGLNQPGFVPMVRPRSSPRDDIEDILDTLSDTCTGGDVGVSVRDPESRGHEDRVVNLLLEAAGPPPSSLAFPALAEVERKRADSLAQVRFLRIRLSRLVMFGSMTSATNGHGWQLRFRLPAFAKSPAWSDITGRLRGNPSATKGGAGGSTSTNVISLPVPARATASSHGRGNAMGKGKTASLERHRVGSMLRVRRGCGAADLVVGETSLLEEVLCAINVDDVCVRRWMEAVVEFLLVDGRTNGTPTPQQDKQSCARMRHGRSSPSSTVGPGDRVAAVATVPLRDLLLSADLFVTATIDLTEVVDFWAAEDTRIAASSRSGRGGRPLRNPYRSKTASAARPLVLGERAVGALAIALELVPGHQADVLPEDCRPEVQPMLTSVTSRRGMDQERNEGLEYRQDAIDELQGENVLNWKGRDDEQVRAPEASLREGIVPLQAFAGGGSREDQREISVTEAAHPEVGSHAPREEVCPPDNRACVVNTPSAPPLSKVTLTDGHKKSIHQMAPTCEATASSNEGMTVVLRLDMLMLAPAAAPGVNHIRVAYSFNQAVEHAPAVTHRSVHGFRSVLPPWDGGTPSPVFKFHHEEIVPAAFDGKNLLLGPSSSRMFEVWAPRTEGGDGSSEGDGLATQSEEKLLGLAKVSLVPFAAFFGDGDRDDRRWKGVGLKSEFLCVAVDGPVSVIDPFSGKAVGELRIFIALRAPPSVTVTQGTTARSQSLCLGTNEIGQSPKQDVLAPLKARGMSRRVERKQRTGFPEEIADEVKGRSMGDTSSDSHAELSLDDSVTELSKLLNPARANQGEVKQSPESLRNSDSFTGLVRHVIELGVEGEVPTAWDDEAEQEGAGEGPLGCAIEYSFRDGHASLDLDDDQQGFEAFPSSPDQKHELWWDADSAILNSRARHSIKIPGGLLDFSSDRSVSGAGTFESDEVRDRGLHRLLNFMFGEGDVQFSIFWKAGGTVAGLEDDLRAQEQERRMVGTAVLSRSDLLPLVKQTSGRMVVQLTIKPPPDNAASHSGCLPSPSTMALSISYRREPSAVARRKSSRRNRRCESSKKMYGFTDKVITREEEGKEEGKSPNENGRGDGELGDDCENSHRLDENRQSSDDGDTLRPQKFNDASQPPRGRPVETVHRAHSVVHDNSKGLHSAKFQGETDSGRSSERGVTWTRRSSMTEHLLPACTTICICVESVDFTLAKSLDSVDKPNRPGGSINWASFDFSGHDSSTRMSIQEESERFGQSTPREGLAVEREEHFSQPVPLGQDGIHDRALLQWNIEFPVTINSKFVQYMHTQALEIRVWSAPSQKSWPRSGTVVGVARVALRPLLTTLGGFRGRVNLSPPDGANGHAGSVALRLCFKHHGLDLTNELPPVTTPSPLPSAKDKDAASSVSMTGRSHQDNQQSHGSVSFADTNKTGDDVLTCGPSKDAGVPAGVKAQSSVAGSGHESWEGESAPQSESVPNGGKLSVFIERAMRLPSCNFPPEELGSRIEVLPSTYVTFGWEEGGKIPLRPPFIAGGIDSKGGLVEAAAREGNGEYVTPMVKNSANPVFEHETELCLARADAWARVCSPSAALVFRVWRCGHYRWWGSSESRTSSIAAATEAPNGSDGGTIEVSNEEALSSSARFGDTLVGSAVVSLEVLRGCVAKGTGQGLSEINGWYHVLDDLRRPQGQLKVRVKPRLPAMTSSTAGKCQGTGLDTVTPLGSSDIISSENRPPISTLMGPAVFEEFMDRPEQEIGGWSSTGPEAQGEMPPLHNAEAHLRAVHALLDSLPAEFRSTERRSSVSTSGQDMDTVEERRPATITDAFAREEPSTPPGGDVDRTPSPGSTRDSLEAGAGTRVDSPDEAQCPSMPEIRHLLSSLDKMDRRLFALAPSGMSRDLSSISGGTKQRWKEAGRYIFSSNIATNKERSAGEIGIIAKASGRLDPIIVEHAARRIQRLWRVTFERLRTVKKLQVEEDADRLREAQKHAAATKIQGAHRRAQARYRAKITIEERRRWEARQQRRAVACATLERAWKAFELRRSGRRELTEARARAKASAAAAASRRVEECTHAATRIQTMVRRALARAQAHRQKVVSGESDSKGNTRRDGQTLFSAGSRHEAKVVGIEPLVDGLMSPAPRGSSTYHIHVPFASPIAPRPLLSTAVPSTFYNQLAQDPRRWCPLPETHMAPARNVSPNAVHSSSICSATQDGTRTKGTSVGSEHANTAPRQRPGVMRPPRFADLETERIARIMRGNLQQWAGVRSGGEGFSSSDELDL